MSSTLSCTGRQQERRLRNNPSPCQRHRLPLTSPAFRKHDFCRKTSYLGQNQRVGLKVAISTEGPFGELLRATGPMAKANPFRFSSKYTDDESDLVYYGYRYYNPSTGRWISRDPAEEPGFDLVSEEAEGEPDSQNDGNLFRFVGNSPLNKIDNTGLWPSSHHYLGYLVGLDTPLTHQQSIARAIPGLNSHDYNILCAATVEVDEGQGTDQSYEHAMRDGLKRQSVSSARNMANDFVRTHLAKAKLLLCSCSLAPDDALLYHDEALHEFGLALHTIQDATSPSHTGFQPWYGDGWGHKSEALAHVRKEDYDPGAGSHLDKATAWFWTFFSCGQSAWQLPQDFFSDLGSDPAAP